MLTLPTSQALWRTGRVWLDPLEMEPVRGGQTLADLEGTHSAFVNGHWVDFFPPGTAILTLPVTALFDLLGFNLAAMDQNFAVQNRLVFVTTTVTVLLFYGLGRLFLPPLDAALIATVSMLGSVLLSSTGAALFSINYTVIAITLALLLLAAAYLPPPVALKRDRWRVAVHRISLSGGGQLLLGLLLFVAFLCRASTATFIVAVFSFLALSWLFRSGEDTHFRLRNVSAPAVTALLLLALFGLWAQLQYGRLLPPYYGATQGSACCLTLVGWDVRQSHQPVAGALCLYALFAAADGGACCAARIAPSAAGHYAGCLVFTPSRFGEPNGYLVGRELLWPPAAG